jgi:hypothetical protein
MTNKFYSLCFLSIKTRKKPLDFCPEICGFFGSSFAPFEGLFLVCLWHPGRKMSADSLKRFCKAPPIAAQKEPTQIKPPHYRKSFAVTLCSHTQNAKPCPR